VPLLHRTAGLISIWRGHDGHNPFSGWNGHHCEVPVNFSTVGLDMRICQVCDLLRCFKAMGALIILLAFPTGTITGRLLYISI
jgi:hypothetical protein